MWDWLTTLWSYLENITKLPGRFLDWCLDFAFNLLSGLLTGIEVFFAALPSVPGIPVAPWSGMPSLFYGVADSLNLGVAFGIVGGSYLVRFLINLIPSWATRA